MPSPYPAEKRSGVLIILRPKFAAFAIMVSHFGSLLFVIICLWMAPRTQSRDEIDQIAYIANQKEKATGSGKGHFASQEEPWQKTGKHHNQIVDN
jgi:hypothetical protein